VAYLRLYNPNYIFTSSDCRIRTKPIQFKRCDGKEKARKLNEKGFIATFFFEEDKFAHLNWHQRKSNLTRRGGAHSQVPSQYHQANPSGFGFIATLSLHSDENDVVEAP